MTPMQAQSDDTIVALASAPGRAGVAVLRLSGPQVPDALQALGVHPLPAARHATLRRLRHPQSGDVLDQGLVLYFAAPHSFTGEDVAELQVHGSRAVVASLLSCLCALPHVRLAEPGEFARRAFYHHKLNLAELEGLADLIDAETDAQRAQALRLMEGSLSYVCEALRQGLMKTLAYAEAFLDFPDEDLPPAALAEMNGELAQAASDIATLLARAGQAETIREGFRVALLGAPNAGKSSLLNALAQREVAIVTERAGTTRDILEVRLNLQGYLVILADMAGLRETDDAIEQEGIRRALAYAREADLRLWLVDGSQPASSLEATGLMYQPGDLIVFTKQDLPAHPSLASQTAANLKVSAQTGEGIPQLLQALGSHMMTRFTASETCVLVRQRHVNAFHSAQQHLTAAMAEDDLTLKAEEIRLAIRAISAVIGAVDVEDILDIVFGSFCLGK
jgi:tRNA modification GTPase